MIEVRKLIPQYYNQSRDMSVFLGEIQILLNQLDQKSRVLLELPAEDILPGKLSTYSKLRSNFRLLLKNKGSIDCLLSALSLCGGDTWSFEEEKDNIEWESTGLDPEYFSRNLEDISQLPADSLGYLVYYQETTPEGVYKLYINVKDRSLVDYDLFNKLCYYLKPVNTIIEIKQASEPI